MKTLQNLFVDLNKNIVTIDDLTTIKVVNRTDSDTGDLWAISVESSGEIYGGTVIVSPEQKDHMEHVYGGQEDFAATIVNGELVQIV